MQPTEFIFTAQRLASDDASEGDLRTAVSRAYYGAFHSCSLHIPPEFEPDSRRIREAGSHKAMIDAVGRWGRSLKGGRSAAQIAARKLGQLKNLRVMADYTIDVVVPLDAKGCIADAYTVAESISEARRRYDQENAV